MELEDIHILAVAKQLTEIFQIRELGVKLGSKATNVHSVLENNKDDINEAAYKVLRRWFQGQSDRKTASGTSGSSGTSDKPIWVLPGCSWLSIGKRIGEIASPCVELCRIF